MHPRRSLIENQSKNVFLSLRCCKTRFEEYNQFETCKNAWVGLIMGTIFKIRCPIDWWRQIIKQGDTSQDFVCKSLEMTCLYLIHERLKFTLSTHVSQTCKTSFGEHRDNKQATFIARAPKVLVDLHDWCERKLKYRMMNGDSENHPLEEEIWIRSS